MQEQPTVDAITVRIHSTEAGTIEEQPGAQAARAELPLLALVEEDVFEQRDVLAVKRSEHETEAHEMPVDALSSCGEARESRMLLHRGVEERAKFAWVRDVVLRMYVSCARARRFK